MSDDAGRMPPLIRAGVAISGAVSAVLAVGFTLQWSAVTDLWPWPEGRYSYLFIGSILAAITAAAVWVWWANDLGILAPGALNLTVLLGGQSGYLFILYGRRDQSNLLVTALVLGVGAVANGVVWGLTRRLEPRDPTPLPPAARIAFAGFVVALVAAGVALLLGAERVFPWEVRSDSAVMFGWIFLGDACFFAYGVLRPRWAYAGPQLLAFLAYDLVLIGPFLGLADDVADGLGLSLVVYTSVLVISGVVAVWFLAVDRTTRVRG